MTKKISKYIQTFLISIILCIMIMALCSCGNNGDSVQNDDNQSTNQPTVENYPVEGIWYGTIKGTDLRNIKNECLSQQLSLKYYMQFLPGGAIKTMWELGEDKSSWTVEDFVWEIKGYIVDLSTDKKIIIVDDVFRYQIPSIDGYLWTWYNTNQTTTTFSKVDKVLGENKV